MKLGVYAICKNEINNLDKWYDSVKVADYICVLDTGSTDGTWEKLQSLPIICKQTQITPWDFGEARTLAFTLLPEDTEICVHIDIDEYFSKDTWVEKLKSAWKGVPQKIMYNSVNKDTPLGTKYISHPYDKNLRWDYPIFEEPIIYGESSKNFLWNYIENPAQYVDNVLFTHNKDDNKERKYYDDLILKRVLFCMDRIESEGMTDREKLNILFSLLESIMILKDTPKIRELLPIILSIIQKVKVTDYKESYQKYLSLLNYGALANWNALVEACLSDLEEFEFGVDLVSEAIILHDSLFYTIKYHRGHLLNKIKEYTKEFPLIPSSFSSVYFTHQIMDSCRDSFEFFNLPYPKTLLSNLDYLKNKLLELVEASS